MTSLISPDGSITDPFRNFIAVSRYARWLDDEMRRETWEETVDRYIAFFKQHLQKFGKSPDDPIYDEVREAILNHEIMPSMRALMTAGPALERSHIAGYNCLKGSERYMTADGLKTFVETAGTTQLVLDADGNWTEAEIKYFGKQRLQRVTFRPDRYGTQGSRTSLRVTVDATPDHRWVLADTKPSPALYTETTALKVGDRVPFIGNSVATNYRMGRVDSSPESLDGWINGFGFGDGTLDSRGRARVRLCGDKAEFREVFEAYGNASISTPAGWNGDVLVTFHKGHFGEWKSLPDVSDKSPEWICAWIEGYLDADGSKTETSEILSSQNAEAIEFVKIYASYAGFMVTGHNVSTVMETNYGSRSAPLHRLTLANSGFFRVTSIEDLEVEEDVYCAVVPSTHSFVLEHGILTGNCAFLAVNDPRAFDEALFILLNGTGVGFSVERSHVDQLPVVPTLQETTGRITVGDSKEGWAESFKILLSMLWQGFIPQWDMSQVRPAGARLATFGGRASGPGPLDALFRFAVDLFKNAQGRRLTPLECHDLMCKIGDIVVVGGVRRSALISLSDLNDFEMAKAKSGNWWENNPQRALANNSAVYLSKPPVTQFLREWRNLIESQSGERGIINLEGLQEHANKQGRDGSRLHGVNPCSEILLRDQQYCNLTEVVIRGDDDLASVDQKVYLASILGTWQSTLTEFPYVRDTWRENCEEERLLGVSLTGIYGNKYFNDPDDPNLPMHLSALRDMAHAANEDEAARLGINPSAAVTCVKPSGTVSQLTGVSSGIHPWHAKRYIRSVRGSNNDPLTQMMKDAGIPNEPEVMKPDDTTVFYFPIKAPDGAVTRDQVSAIDHLRLWSIYREYYTDHNPSVTINVREDEWMAVGTYVFENWDKVGGISFLPFSEHTYQQAPFTECTEEEYFHAVEAMPDEIRWADLGIYELMDSTTGSRELACSASGEGCETVDITS